MDRPDRDEEGNWIYYASELGGCTKALIAKRMGKVAKVNEPDGSDSTQESSRLARLFSEGNLHEGPMLDAYQARTLLPVFNRQDVISLSVGVPGTIIIGHQDGENPYEVIEAKTMGDSSFKEFKRRLWDTPGLVQKYKWQLSVYGFAKEKPGRLLVKNRNDGETIQLLMDSPFYNYDDFQNRILHIETCAETGELPVDCDFPNFPCPYEYLHNERKVIRSDAEVDMLVNTYLDAKRAEVEAAIRAGAARQLLGETLGDADKLETTGGSRIVRYGTKENPMYRISTRQVKEDGLDGPTEL